MKRRILLLIILAVIAAATLLAVYIFVYNKPHTDFSKAEAEFTLTPGELFNAFISSQDEANALYNGKTIAIKGVPDDFETVDSLSIAVFYLSQGDFGPEGVRCTFLPGMDGGGLEKGQEIHLKGFCSGYNGSDVILENCSLVRD